MALQLIVMAALTAYTAHSQREAGKQQKYDLERQAEQEELAAKNEEVIRRERLNKVLAANVSSVAASQARGESLKSVSLEGARRASFSEGAESLSDRLRQDLLKREGRRAKEAGQRQAGSTLLKGFERGSQLS